MCLQHFSGLLVTSAGPVTHHFVAGHQRTQAPGGKSSPAVPRLLTRGLTWTIQVRGRCSRLIAPRLYTFPLSLSLISAVLSNRRIRELHLHFSNRSSGDQGGSAGQPHGHVPGLGPLRVILVPHVWVAHRHAAYQTAQADR